MGISEREHHIKVLEKLLKETKGKIELYSENKNIDLTKEKEIVETLGYAISSLKTDFKYDLMYEGEEIYTKADIVAILEELRTQMEKYEPKWVENDEQAVASCRTWEDLDDIIQQKIDKLKENTDVNK